MQRTAKRIYSPKALETWLERLQTNWEENFSTVELSNGRSLYRDGKVNEIEVHPDVLIVHTKENKELYYSVIEWKNSKPDVRASVEDRTWGRSLAIAGLYESEELFADELSEWSFIDSKPTKPRQDTSDQKKPNPNISKYKGIKARELKLSLSTTPQGLKIEAFWLSPDAQPEPALSIDTRKLEHPLERERIIRLTSLLRKSNFVHRKHSHYYVLREISAIPGFLKNTLPKWRESFSVSEDETITKLKGGIRDVKVTVKASEGPEGLTMQWSVKTDGFRLPDDLALKVLRRNGQPLLSTEYGILRVPKELINKVADLEAFTNGEKIPHYMLFSLFGQDKLQLEFTPELKLWQEQFKQAPQNKKAKTHLRPYQQKGVEWMRHLFEFDCHGLLGDEMGLGKTMQVLDLLNNPSLTKVQGKSHLIICPASVVPVWKQEAAHFYPNLKIEILGKGNDFISHTEPAIWVASYTQIRRHKPLLDKIEFGFSILDEAQMIKNPDAKATQACMAIKAKHRLAVTGTPLENRELDLWTLFRYLMPGLLGPRNRLDEMLQTSDKAQVHAKLRAQIAPFILRRTKAEVATDLPPKQEMVIRCPLTPLQRKAYNKIIKEGKTGLQQPGKPNNAISLFAILTRLRQACCDPALLPWVNDDTSHEHSGKLNILLEKLEEVISLGGKVVVFSQFVTLLKRVEATLKQEFPDLPLFMLTGSTKDRQKPVDQFQKMKKSSAMLISLKAGGTGITLHSADYVFLLDPWWNPAVENQAIDRVHRIGQKKKVFVYRLITEETIEERVESLKQEKAKLFKATVGSIEDNSVTENHNQSMSNLMGLVDIFRESKGND